MVMKGVVIVQICLHLYSTAVTTTLSPFSPYAYFLVTNMWYFSGVTHLDGNTSMYQKW